MLLVRICWWPRTVVLPAAEVLISGFLDLFGSSIFGFWISGLVAAASSRYGSMAAHLLVCASLAFLPSLSR